MAIDTETKRRSVQAYTFGLMRPRADGAVDSGDRATAAWLYSGLDYGDTPPVVNRKDIGLFAGQKTDWTDPSIFVRGRR